MAFGARQLRTNLDRCAFDAVLDVTYQGETAAQGGLAPVIGRSHGLAPRRGQPHTHFSDERYQSLSSPGPAPARGPALSSWGSVGLTAGAS